MAATSAVLAFQTSPAAAEVTVGDTLGVTEADIRTNLEAAGYTVLDVEIEDDELEAEVLVDGIRMEVEIAPDTGMVTEIEQDD